MTRGTSHMAHLTFFSLFSPLNRYNNIQHMQYIQAFWICRRLTHLNFLIDGHAIELKKMVLFCSRSLQPFLCRYSLTSTKTGWEDVVIFVIQTLWQDCDFQAHAGVTNFNSSHRFHQHASPIPVPVPVPVLYHTKSHRLWSGTWYLVVPLEATVPTG